MTPIARLVMEKVRQTNHNTHEEWVQAIVDTTLREAGIVYPEWQPIETVPKDGTRVILFTPPYGAGSGHWDDGCEAFIKHFTLYRSAKSTHWMPFPAVPRF